MNGWALTYWRWGFGLSTAICCKMLACVGRNSLLIPRTIPGFQLQSRSWCYIWALPWQYSVAMLSDRDQERFMRLWTEIQPAVVNYIHATIRDPTAAKDLVQETALVLFRRFTEFDGDRPFLAWALGVAKFQVLGFHRDAARSLVCFDTELFDQFTEMWAETAAAGSERSTALELCLERLPARPRQMVRLRYFEELNSEEIAHRLGSKSAAVRVALQRIREQLRACVEQQLRTERQAT